MEFEPDEIEVQNYYAAAPIPARRSAVTGLFWSALAWGKRHPVEAGWLACCAFILVLVYVQALSSMFDGGEDDGDGGSDVPIVPADPPAPIVAPDPPVPAPAAPAPEPVTPSGESPTDDGGAA